MFSLFAFLKYLLAKLVAHFNLLYLDLDSVKDAHHLRITQDELLFKKNRNSTKTSKQPSINHEYLLPLLSMLYIVLDSLYIVTEHHLNPSSNVLSTLWWRRVYPPSLGPIADVMMSLAIWMSVTVFACLLIDEKPNGSLLMFLFVDPKTAIPSIIQNAKLLNSEVSLAIYKFRKIASTIRPLINLNLMTVVGLFFGYNFTFNWTGSLHDYIMVFCTICIVFYAVYSNVLMIFDFLLTLRYLQLKQKFKMLQFGRLSTALRVKKARPTNYKTNQMNQHLWAKLKQLIGTFSVLYKEIRCQNRFWSKYLTSYFAVYIIELCYLTYAFFFASQRLGIEKYFLVFMDGNFLIILLLVTLQCSAIVYKNGRLFRQSQSMAMKISTIHSLRLGDLLKVDGMAASYGSIEEICFKLVTGHKINSQMFQMLFTYTSLLFLMVFKNMEQM